MGSLEGGLINIGRYITGDIEGKFWFAVQSSSDADFFGYEGQQPNYLEYCFDKEHLPEIEKGIEKCEEELGEYKEKFDKFFKKDCGYNDEQLKEEVGRDAIKKLTWYARLELGKKILKCVKKTGYCNFQAEC